LAALSEEKEARSKRQRMPYTNGLRQESEQDARGLWCRQSLFSLGETDAQHRRGFVLAGERPPSPAIAGTSPLKGEELAASPVPPFALLGGNRCVA
jgi:hypothetical protein